MFGVVLKPSGTVSLYWISVHSSAGSWTYDVQPASLWITV